METSQDVTVRETNIVRRTETFGGAETAVATDTAATAVAAQARALVEGRFVMALRRPRDWDDVRTRLLRESERPSFAAVARYRKPVGKGVEGPSIRFAEAALRIMGNVDCNAMTVYEDIEKRVVRVTVTDLESNTDYASDITVEKTVERKKADDRQVIGQRRNSKGEVVYIVVATEDELLNKEGARISKAIRNNGLRLLPGDILDEAMARVIVTMRSRTAQDPDKARKEMADAFFTHLNVRPSELKRYLGHALEQCSPAEIEDLRAVYQTIRDGEATWASVVEEREQEREAESRQAASATADTTEALREQARAANATAPAPAPPADATPPAPAEDCNCPDGPDNRHLTGCRLAPPDVTMSTTVPDSPKAKGRLF